HGPRRYVPLGHVVRVLRTEHLQSRAAVVRGHGPDQRALRLGELLGDRPLHQRVHLEALVTQMHPSSMKAGLAAGLGAMLLAFSPGGSAKVTMDDALAIKGVGALNANPHRAMLAVEAEG